MKVPDGYALCKQFDDGTDVVYLYSDGNNSVFAAGRWCSGEGERWISWITISTPVPTLNVSRI